MDLFDESYLKQVRRFRKFNQAEKSAYELKKHYEYYNDSTEDINQIFNTTFDTETYSEKEKREIFNNTISLLEMKYNLKVISVDPLRIEKFRK